MVRLTIACSAMDQLLRVVLWMRNVFTVMTADIRKLVHAVPFVPFTIHLAEGGQLRVPRVDHVAVPPTGRRIFVFGDDEGYDVVSAMLISRITVDRESAPSKNQGE